MRVFYYNLDDAAFVDENGDQLSRIVPDLYYQEDPDWRFMLRRGTNSIADLSGVVAWGAAVDCDFSTSSVPMCRTLSDGIVADPQTGAVTVSLDCTTAEFLAAVDGNPARQAWFELYGLDANGKRILYFCIEIRARMVIDPDPEVSPETPDTVATKAYVSAVMSSGAAASGAIVSGAEFRTSVGDYLLTYTSSGGLMISGGGVQLQVSSGAIVASASGGEYGEAASFALTSSGVTMVANDEGHDASLTVRAEGDVDISATGADKHINLDCDNEVLVNGRPVATQLVASTSDDPSAFIDVLSGGTSLVYTGALYQVEVSSVAKSTEASYLHFTLDSDTAPTPVVISGVSNLNSATFEGGKEYLVGFFDGMAVVNEVTSGGAV